jgi:hypothetical protein
MSNEMYGKCKEHICLADLDWINDDIGILFVDTDSYTVDLDSDEYLSDIPSEAIVYQTTSFLQNNSCTLGVCDADDFVLNQVSVSNANAMILYKDTGTDSTSILLIYIDTASSLPLSTTGANITIKWPTGDNKIFVI